MTTDTVSVDKADLRKAIKLLFALVATNQEHVNLMNRLNAALKQPAAPDLSSKVSTLFDAIAHGDEDHRRWLKSAIDSHFFGCGNSVAIQQPECEPAAPNRDLVARIKETTCEGSERFLIKLFHHQYHRYIKDRLAKDFACELTGVIRALYTAPSAQQPDPRTQLLAYVPKLSEWPEEATHWGINSMGDAGYYAQSGNGSWLLVDLDYKTKVPKNFIVHWERCLFTRDEVKAARGHT